MRSAFLSRVAFSLMAVEFVAASPCKPSSAPISSTAISDASTATLPVPSIETATSVGTTTSFASVTFATSTDSVEIIHSSATLDTIVTSGTTEFITTTTAAPVTETTSAAPIQTFTLLATGQGPMAGRGLQTIPQNDAYAAFDAPVGSNPDWSFSVRSFTLDSRSRLVNDLGWFLCGLYSPQDDLLDAPAYVETCKEETPLERAFLTCKLGTDLKVKCSIPAVSCLPTGVLFDPPVCQSAPGTWSVLSTGMAGPGHVLVIGNDATPDYYDRLELGVKEV